MTLAKVGRRGSLVIPAEEREKAEIADGDRLEVTTRGKGLILLRKVPSLKHVRQRLAGRLPPWAELEGKADRLIAKET